MCFRGSRNESNLDRHSVAGANGRVLRNYVYWFGKVETVKYMAPVLTALLLLAASDADAALADRARLPVTERHYAVYLTLATVDDETLKHLSKATPFAVASLSSKTYLADQLPVPVPGTRLVRLNLRGLGWSPAHYADVMQRFYVPKYRPDLKGLKVAPLVVRADWFVANMLDAEVTGNAQQLFLYGKELRTVDEFLKAWGIQNDPEFVFGIIESNSGVAEERTRLIENRPGSKRNQCWITHDSARIAGETDPLENLPNKAKFDAQELIAGMPKWYSGKSGKLQAYLLGNGQGKTQTVAPAKIVVDHTQVRGVEIRNSSSCIFCHTDGLRSPTIDQTGRTLDGFRQYIESGARVAFKDKNQQEATDRYHTSDLAKEIRAGQQEYADGLKLVNGLTPQENSAAFAACVRFYDAPLGLEQQAREVYLKPDGWRLALGYYSSKYGLTGRLAEASQGKPITREMWEENFGKAMEIAKLWHASQN